MIIRKIIVAFATFSLLIVFTSFSFAKEEKSATPAASPKIEYNLPYPGILPDHPLYFLKMARDRVLGWFITDPLKKAEYNLLMADKRLNSGLSLLEKGKTDLAEPTFSKGEKYLEKALDEAEEAQKVGRDTGALMSKLSLATLKHQEVLNEVLQKVPEAAKKGIQNALEKSQKGAERVREVQKKKLEQRLQKRILGQKPGVAKVEAKGR